MPIQQIIWTALPNGLHEPPSLTTLKLSVFVSPRLGFGEAETIGTLASFPDFLDWPARVQSNQIGFKVVVDDNVAEAIPAHIVTRTPPDSTLWKALFHSQTPVRSHAFEAARDPIASYPAAATAGGIAEGYTTIGISSPYVPASKEVVAAAFPSLAAAMQRDATPIAPTLAQARKAMAQGPEALRRAHQAIADSLLRHDAGGNLASRLELAISVASELANSSAPDEVVPIVPATSHDASPFIQFAAFHERSPTVRSSSAASGTDLIDFHQMLSALGEYPELLRRLGLAIDLEFAATEAARSRIGALKHLRVEVNLTSGNPKDNYTPVTKYILDDRTAGNPLPFPLFAAAPRRAAQLLPSNGVQEPNFEVVAGLLNLGIPRPDAPHQQQFDLIKIDVDGAGQKILNALREIADDQAPSGRPIDSSATSAAPAFRASGLSLVRSGQAAAIKADQARSIDYEAAMREGRQAELFAEDLVRGYRIDVRTFPAAGLDSDALPWLSLHKRIMSFAIARPGAADLTIPGVRDEGFVQPCFVQEPNGAAANPIYVSESFCHWQGWSLSAPPPADPMDLSSPGAGSAAPSALPSISMIVEAEPGSLPRLRYGDNYQFRVRTVDLAGNGLSVEQANAILRELRVHGRPEPFIPIIAEDLPYRRYEPVPAPVLVPREEMTEGEALDVLVVRSNGPGTTTQSYATDTLGGGRYKGVNERHIAPPMTSQSSAEIHGAFDGAFGASGDPSKFFRIWQRSGGTLNDNFVINLATGAPEMLPDLIDPATGAHIPNGIRFVKIAQPVASPGAENAGYSIHYEQALRLPYLPDPLARGAALFGLPGSDGKSLVLKPATTPGGPAELKREPQQLLPPQAINALGFVTKIDFGPGDSWPELRPFVLQLDGMPAGPTGDPVWHEQGGVRRLTVRLAPGQTKTVWLSCFPDAKDVSLFGLHFWWKDRVGAPEGDRTFLNMAQHGALSMLTPARKLTLVHAVQQPIIAPVPDGAPFALEKFPAGTQVYIQGGFRIDGLSTAKLDLFASWTEPNETDAASRTFETHVFEFPIYRDSGPPPPPGDPVPIAKYIQETERVELFAPESEVEAVRRRWLARHEFNDTKHRVVSYRLVATTRFREFFPERITRDIKNVTRETAFPDMIVMNSAKPPVPEISHIVPSFAWKVNSSLTRSERIGGGLRVYLGSAWYATGAEEQIVIVGNPEAGVDPIHAASGQGPAHPIKPTVDPVVVPGFQTPIYPFAVHFDADRKLWYSDLTFDASTNYFPFVKLVLARYQAHSLQGMHLSNPIEAGMYQLAPDRIAELGIFDGEPDAAGKRRITITIKGSGPSAARLAATERSVNYGFEVSLEERPKVFDTDERDPHLGWALAASTEQPGALGPSSDPSVLWQGQLLTAQFPSKEQRIVIREYEFFENNQMPPGQGWIGLPADGPSRRLTYAEVFPIIS